MMDSGTKFFPDEEATVSDFESHFKPVTLSRKGINGLNSRFSILRNSILDNMRRSTLGKAKV